MKMSPNLSRPESIGTVDPAVFDALQGKYNGLIKRGTQFPGFFALTARDNREVLDVLGSYKTDVIDYAQDTHRRLVKRIEYVADMTDAEIGKQQRQTGYHTEQVPNGITILASSALPTVFITGTSSDIDPSNYLNGRHVGLGSMIYDAELIKEGVEDGVLEKFVPEPGAMIELDGRIHCSPANLTGEIVRRAFLGCEITFKRK